MEMVKAAKRLSARSRSKRAFLVTYKCVLTGKWGARYVSLLALLTLFSSSAALRFATFALFMGLFSIFAYSLVEQRNS